MRVYELHDRTGHTRALEIPVPLVGGRRRIISVLRGIPGVVVTKAPVPFSWMREDTFCRFELGGTAFVVAEPFGDNSRYLVSPESQPAVQSSMLTLISAFKSA